ncbi:MAG: CDP-diacylglycerol--glycerol-3-phosphate 3-phosphatidyltransferase [Verrucomicrobia bacterium]|nr:CDP-diacylglycerol--glycerol-3-phosphate 3-phosphatidyltransferase [Verrucomicrobiota bacterium]
MNLPNKLTLARIVLTAFFVMALLLPHFPCGKTVAFWLFIIASLTDWWDGWFARRYKQTTPFGVLLDPLADKILTCAAFVCFVEIKTPKGLSLVQAWMAVVIIAREFIISGLRLLAAQKGAALPADLMGKQKTISQMVSIGFILLGLMILEDWPQTLGDNTAVIESNYFPVIVFWLMMLTVLLTVISGVSYLIRGHKLFTEDT